MNTIYYTHLFPQQELSPALVKRIGDYVAKWKTSADECILKQACILEQARINLEHAKFIEQQLKTFVMKPNTTKVQTNDKEQEETNTQ